MTYRSLDRFVRFPLWFGVVLVVVGFVAHYVGVQGVENLGIADADLLEPTPIEWSVRPGSASAGAFGASLYASGLHAVYATLSTLGLLASLVGLLSAGIGLLGTRWRAASRALRGVAAAVTDPGIGAVTVLAFGGLYAVLTVRAVRVAVVNLATFSLAAGLVFVLSVGALAWVERRADALLTVLVVGPLSVAAVFLSGVVGAFASPATGRFMERLTVGIVRTLLSTVLAVGGLNRHLVRAFELQGPAFLAVWLAATGLLGVAVGVAMVHYEFRSVDRVRQWARDAAVDDSRRAGTPRRSD